MVAQDSFISLSARLAMFGMAFVTNIVLARFLGASGMGIWSVMFAFLSIITQLCVPGVGFANVYYVARQKHTIGQTWAATLILGFGFGMMTIILGIILILVKFRSIACIQDKRLLLFLLISIPLTIISSWGTMIIQGMDRIGLMSILEVASQAIHLGLIFLFIVILQWGLWGVVTAYIGWYLSITLALIVTFAILVPPGEFKLSWGVIFANVSYGLKMYLGKLSNWANNRIDLLIAPLFLASTQIGQYAIAVQVTEKLWIFPESMAKAMFPKVSADAKGRPELTAQACRIALMIMLSITILLISVGWWLFPILFGSEFRNSYILMLAILPGALAFGMNRILAMSLAGTNCPGVLSGINAVSAILNIALNFWLVPWLGVIGCSLASTGSYTFEALMLGWYHCRHHDVVPLSLLKIRRSDFLQLIGQSKRLFSHLFS